MWRPIVINIDAKCCCCHKQKQKPRFVFGVGPVRTKQSNEGQKFMDLQVTINNEQEIDIELHPVTTGGHPAELDGEPVWSVLSGDCTVQPIEGEGGKKATIRSGDNPGDSVVQVQADADLGEGVVTITGLIHVSVSGAMAENLGLTAGEPRPKT